MSTQRHFAMTIIVSVAVILAACSNRLVVTEPESLLFSALQVADFPCTELIRAEELGEDQASWRIVCANAQAYLAWMQADDEVCFSLIPYLAPPGLPAGFLTQPPQDEVVRCAPFRPGTTPRG